MIRLVCVFLLWAGCAAAFDYPALFQIKDVAADDQLKARIEPDASSAPVGTYAFDATEIEVIRLSKNGRWGQVNFGERAAWVSMRYLKRTSPQTGPYPSVSCYGTEPFWNFDLRITTHTPMASFQSLDGRKADLAVSEYRYAENRTDRVLFVAGPPRTNSFSHLATVTEALCSDGMSDRTYGLTLDLTIFSGGPSRFLSGCCSLLP